MGNLVFGAFTVLVVVNGQDVRVACSLCGDLPQYTVDRAVLLEARVHLHVQEHVLAISEGHRGGLPLQSDRRTDPRD